MDIRIGHGYDVHRLTSGRPLMLGGVHIPFDRGLDGHSDADVLLHAISDALLGATALGDIGKHFPDNDDRFLDSDSSLLLSEVVRLVRQAGYEISNIDSTVVAQVPKLSPYICDMRERISDTVGISPDRVSVKATTEEGLGITGNGNAICAHAVALIEKTT